VINYKVHKVRKVPKEQWYVVEGTHEPIVAAETFARAQQLLSLNIRAGSKGVVYPLGGILKCGECRKAMCRKTAREHAYYCCRTYREKGRQFCVGHSIREDVLFDTILEAINFQILQMNDMQALVRRINNEPRRNAGLVSIESRLRTSKRELATEAAVFDKSYFDYANGIISEEQFKRVREICEKRQTELRERIESFKQEIKKAAPTERTEHFERFRKEQRFSVLTRGMAFDLIESVYVYGDKSVEVNFKFADQFCVYYSRRQARL
jgi:hypothetical protein